MNNEIQEDYCSFEVSKLLKEKDFAVPTREYYRNYPTAIIMSWDVGKKINGNDDKKLETAGGMTYVSCPTHALAIKWIRENFKLEIEVRRTMIGYTCYVIDASSPNVREWKTKKPEPSNLFQFTEEAAEAALLYTLKTLIQ